MCSFFDFLVYAYVCTSVKKMVRLPNFFFPSYLRIYVVQPNLFHSLLLICHFPFSSLYAFRIEGFMSPFNAYIKLFVLAWNFGFILMTNKRIFIYVILWTFIIYYDFNQFDIYYCISPTSCNCFIFSNILMHFIHMFTYLMNKLFHEYKYIKTCT